MEAKHNPPPRWAIALACAAPLPVALTAARVASQICEAISNYPA